MQKTSVLHSEESRVIIVAIPVICKLALLPEGNINRREPGEGLTLDIHFWCIAETYLYICEYAREFFISCVLVSFPALSRGLDQMTHRGPSRSFSMILSSLPRPTGINAPFQQKSFAQSSFKLLAQSCLRHLLCVHLFLNMTALYSGRRS